ncbi:MAG TPA: ABC transporter ATP-binding protein, partial [Syntrophomonas sp.]|nr:ABC transporter ATP-binding protein [Syntrophomonas sp.]
NYAIVGYNGSGKSTLIKLILGLYTPTKGEMLINGISIDRYDKEAYFEKMSATFQDPVKLPLTVRENIGISRSKDIGDMEIIKKASAAGKSYDFINSLRNKFETKLLIGWKNSEELSTGQWQRIAISRGFVRDSQVMVFDEPTASLDAKSESEVFKNVMSKNSIRINILITHRFVNIYSIDEIIVLNQGEINGIGNHDFLFRTNGLYYDLYRTQADYYIEAHDEIEAKMEG